MLLTSWELIFLQSRVNNGGYDGDHLPTQNWDWPRGTWFQERLRYLSVRRGAERSQEVFTIRLRTD
jgi:hypothetical protein